MPWGRRATLHTLPFALARRGASRAESAFDMRRTILWLALLGALAVWARVSTHQTVFVQGEVLPFDGDSAYHLRRILATLEHFPDVPARDPYLNWPRGAYCPWAPGFDFLAACWVFLSGAASDSGRAARAACLFPVLIGVAVVWATFLVTRRLAAERQAGSGIAGAAGILVALIPQSIDASGIGCGDLHGAEALAMALLGWWGLSALNASEEERASLGSRAVRFEAAGALLAAAAFFVFAGAILYVGIAVMLVVGAAAARGTPPTRRASVLLGSGAPALAAAALLVALLYTPSIREHGRAYSFQVPSYLQAILLLGTAAACASAAAARLLIRANRITPGVIACRIALVLLGSALAAGLLVAAAPGAAQAALAGLTGWLGRRDPWIAGIREFQPIFLEHSPLSRAAVARLDELFGALGPAAFLVLPIGLYAILRGNRRDGVLFLVWTAAVTALTIWQSRFARLFVVNLAVVAAFSFHALLGALARRRALPGGVVVAAAAVFAIADPRLRAHLAVAPPRTPTALESAALFLRDHAPPVEPGARSGVLADWDFGHSVLWLARRPVVASGFGPYGDAEDGFADAENAPLGSEEALLEIMDRRDLGYLIGGASTFLGRVMGPKGTGIVDADYLRATPLATLWVAGSGLPEAGVPQIAHLSALFASPQTFPAGGQAIPWLWVYERVPGARLVGRARPGARVVARLELAARGQVFIYAAWADAGENGEYAIVVALPTEAHREGVVTDYLYRIDDGEGPPHDAAVPESAVREGSIVAVGAS